MMTLQTHTRNPGRLFAELGLMGGATVFAVLTGTIASSLLGPLFMAGVVLDAACGPLLRPATPAEIAWSTLVLCMLVAGGASLIAPAVLAIRRRRLTDMRHWPMALVPYIGLMSWASWRALVEVAVRPYAWTKTEHGVAKNRPVHGPIAAARIVPILADGRGLTVRARRPERRIP